MVQNFNCVSKHETIKVYKKCKLLKSKKENKRLNTVIWFFFFLNVKHVNRNNNNLPATCHKNGLNDLFFFFFFFGKTFNFRGQVYVLLLPKFLNLISLNLLFFKKLNNIIRTTLPNGPLGCKIVIEGCLHLLMLVL